MLEDFYIGELDVDGGEAVGRPPPPTSSHPPHGAGDPHRSFLQVSYNRLACLGCSGWVFSVQATGASL